MRALLGRDLARFAQRPRYFVLRSLTVGLPLPLLLVVTGCSFRLDNDDIGQALLFLSFYPLVVALILITPGLLALQLAEEREDGKLDVLRSASLSVRDIVLGKWLSRVLLVGSMVVAALPLPAAALLFGGVAPGQFFRAILVVGSLLLWISALALRLGAKERDPGAAGTRATLWIVGLLGVISVLEPICRHSTSLGLGASGAPLAQGLSLLSPFHMMGLSLSLDPGADSIGGVERVFASAGLCLLLTAALLWSSARALRAEAGTMAGAASSSAPATFSGPRPKAPWLLWRHPLVWLERRRSGLLGGGRRRWGLWLIVLAAEVGIFSLAGVWPLGDGIHFTAAAAVTCFAFLLAALTAANAFHKDSSANTREVLWSTPVSSKELALAKVEGVWRSVRPLWWLALIHVLFASVDSSLTLFGVVVFAGVSWILLQGLIAFALRVSVLQRSRTAALLKTLFWLFGHLCIYPMFGAIMAGAGGELGFYLFLMHHPVVLSSMSLVLFSVDEWMEPPGAAIFFLFFWSALYLGVRFAIVRNLLPDAVSQLREEAEQKPAFFAPVVPAHSAESVGRHR